MRGKQALITCMNRKICFASTDDAEGRSVWTRVSYITALILTRRGTGQAFFQALVLSCRSGQERDGVPLCQRMSV